MPTPPVDRAAVMAALAEFQDPETGRSVTQMEQVRDVELAGDTLTLMLALTTHSAPLWQETKMALEQHLRKKFPQLTSVNINMAVHNRPPQKIGNIGLAAKSVIAVGS